jgi:catechol 2,3-dioxygenase-like lactoylglutathione lyase family enzyme
MVFPHDIPRPLHWVFKIGSRKQSIAFFRDLLGMTVLRHEEFDKACEAACNGRYANRWSKTMIGYGPEDTHFVCELTYNYPVTHYAKGNDYVSIDIASDEVLRRVEALLGNFTFRHENIANGIRVFSPDGYAFNVTAGTVSSAIDPVKKLTLHASSMQPTVDYWHGILGMHVVSQSEQVVRLTYGVHPFVLEFAKLPEGESLDHKEAYGRIAFAVNNVKAVEEHIVGKKATVITPYVSLDTPGKATVQVVILGSQPDGYEICFVNEDGFRDLSKVDPAADQLLNEQMAADRSRKEL